MADLALAAGSTEAGTVGGILPAEAHGLVYEVGGKRLIDGVDLRLAGGPITMIMGQSGAGKSMLLQLLHGLVTPSAGEVRWNGRRLDEGVRRRQAMVFQRPVLLRRSAAANIDFVLKLRGWASATRCEELLARVGLAGRGGQAARALSGGEQQRLALARALALEPDVLFLDEPTASLDPGSVLLIEQIVRAESDRGTKIVFVSHDLAQGRRLADEVVFMHGGQVREHGPAEDFFRAPESAAARDYLAGRIVL